MQSSCPRAKFDTGYPRHEPPSSKLNKKVSRRSACGRKSQKQTNPSRICASLGMSIRGCWMFAGLRNFHSLAVRQLVARVCRRACTKLLTYHIRMSPFRTAAVWSRDRRIDWRSAWLTKIGFIYCATRIEQVPATNNHERNLKDERSIIFTKFGIQFIVLLKIFVYIKTKVNFFGGFLCLSLFLSDDLITITIHKDL